MFFYYVTGFSILEATNIAEQNVGVSVTNGRCANDKAYKLNERAILSIETSQIFPEFQQFPLDFSILVEIRTDQGLKANLKYHSKFKDELNKLFLEYPNLF